VVAAASGNDGVDEGLLDEGALPEDGVADDVLNGGPEDPVDVEPSLDPGPAGGCLEVGTSTLSNQAEVDAFIPAGATCVIVHGDLTLTGSVSDLSPLAKTHPLYGVAEVTGTLELVGLNSAELTSLDGLDDVQRVGVDLLIKANGGLTHLAGLSALEEVGGNLDVEANPAMTTLEGLPGALSLGGNFTLDGNGALVDLVGFPSTLQLTGEGADVLIRDNPRLRRLDGIQGLTEVPGDFKIERCAALSNLNGLSGLISVGTPMGGQFKLSQNNVMTNTAGASSLVSVYDLRIERSGALVEIDGFEALATVHNEVRIRDNSSLPQCEVDVLLNRISYDSAVVDHTVGPEARSYYPDLDGDGLSDDATGVGVFSCPDEAPADHVED
jgi:hypothetical protein